MAIEINSESVGCAMRTRTGQQTEELRCARRTLPSLWSFGSIHSDAFAFRSKVALDEPVSVILVRNAG
jgi:hypothetical protein